MSEQIDDGGTAFPEIMTRISPDSLGLGYEDTYSEGGMSMRDYFAAKAMAAIMAHDADPKMRPDIAYSRLASSSYQIADAMIAERKKGQP